MSVYDALPGPLQQRLISEVCFMSTGPEDRSTTEWEAVAFLRTLNAAEMKIWITVEQGRWRKSARMKPIYF